jgi:hypothetical protein
MADKPIIFFRPMVRALLDGRKTQTRRMLKHKSIDLGIAPSANADHPTWIQFYHPKGGPLTCVKRPYAPGDRLWLREAVTWVSAWGWRYRADNDDLTEKRESGEVGKWRPSIHMPRSASRLTLTVTDVRVQRLQEISEEDSQAEGAMFHDGGGLGHSGWRHDYCDVYVNARGSFAALWNSLHGPRAWAENPWVVALTFTIHQGNIDNG